jgi:hypothetical protein
MSTLRVNTLQNTSGVEVYTCKAWVNFDGTGTFSPNPSTTKIRASGNVSSITDNAMGDYTVNFTNALADANYAPVSMSSSASGETQPRQIVYKGGIKTVSALQVVAELDSGTNVDTESVFIAIFR